VRHDLEDKIPGNFWHPFLKESVPRLLSSFNFKVLKVGLMQE